MNHDEITLPPLLARELAVPPGEWQRINARARSRSRRRTALGSTAVLALVAPMGILAATTSSDGNRDIARPAQPTAIDGVREFDVEARNHVLGRVPYPQTPPVGGDHAPVPQQCGVYDEPIHSEHAVHSLEHGAVWISYLPSVEDGEVQLLRDVIRDAGSYGLLSPVPGQAAPVVATAWGRQLQVSSAGDPRLRQFVTLYADGPQAPERGAACFGSTTVASDAPLP
jgi:hypothetical protein